MKTQLRHNFGDIVSLENLLGAWQEFVAGKRHRKDVQEFSLSLMDNLLQLRQDLLQHTYKHGGYQAFNICDPKPRRIHKASVRDRLVHHALHRVLYLFFNRTFIADSFSCRLGKGTHKALERFRQLAYRVSHNHTRTCWVLKCDIRKFFASIDHKTLLCLLGERIPDSDILRLIDEVIGSFLSGRLGAGLPLGNLTSQLFANAYMNEFDCFTKHELGAKHYVRYADDFVLLSEERCWLERQVRPIESYLRDRLHLTLHPQKIALRTLASGIDFLGWVHFPHHRVLRTATKRRMLARIATNPRPATLEPYLGLLRHGNTYKLENELNKRYLLNRENLAIAVDEQNRSLQASLYDEKSCESDHLVLFFCSRPVPWLVSLS